MYVRRQPRKASNNFNYGFPCAAHYCLSQDYVQCIRSIPVVPVLRGFYLATAVQNAEYNAMYKLVLFAPWQCPGEGQCQSPTRFQAFLVQEDARGKYHFQPAWHLTRRSLCRLNKLSSNGRLLAST